MQAINTIKLFGLSLTMACLTCNVAAMENMDHSKMDHSQHSSDEHAQHRAMMNQKGYTRKEASYQFPDVMLTNQHGDKVSIAALFDSKETVMLNFIFTSCTTICPVLTATFSQLQSKYASQIGDVKMVSISIDPEYDTPDRLNQYAQRFHAQEGWTFLTGDLDTVLNVLSAFDAYRGDKMNHVPLALISTPGASGWIRLEGFANAKDLINEYQALKIGHSTDISQR